MGVVLHQTFHIQCLERIKHYGTSKVIPLLELFPQKYPRKTPLSEAAKRRVLI